MPEPLTVELTGPFFEHDPGKTLRGNIEQMMEGVAEEGQRLVRSVLAAGESTREPIARLSPDRVSQHAIGRVRSLSGKKWRATAVISVNNSGLSRVQGISLMAAASSLEGRFHAFRRTASAIRRARAILNADLTKGLT
jgi:hypothetical protein